jgi:hypothetical protein
MIEYVHRMHKDISISIPSSLVSEFETWGKMTARLFGEIRRLQQLSESNQNIPEDQKWYWTKQWQFWEQDADKDITHGRVQGFETMDDLVTALNS